MMTHVRNSLLLLPAWLLLVVAAGFLLPGCSGGDNDDLPAEINGNGSPPSLQPGGEDNNGNEQAPSEVRHLRDPWLRAEVGEMAAYRVYAVAGDEESAEEERWMLRDLTPPRIRRYIGGAMSPYGFGFQPPQTTTHAIEVPRREGGVVAGNWWYSEHATITAESSLTEFPLASGQALEVLEIPLDDGGTVWISEVAPLDQVVRHENPEGELKRELLAHGRWLGSWRDEANGTTYRFTGTQAILDEEPFGFHIRAERSEDALELVLLDGETGDELEEILTLRPDADGNRLELTMSETTHELVRDE